MSYNCADKTAMLLGFTGYSDETLKEAVVAEDYRRAGDNFIKLFPDSVNSKTLAYLCGLYSFRSEHKLPDTLSAASNRLSIKLNKIGGVYEVPVVMNGVLKINFIIDSGASDVSISSDVASTLIKAGTVGYDDWLPGKVYQFADGSYAKSRRFRIKSLSIGGKAIYDVACSISASVEAPMLLGISALEKLGSYSIDYKYGYMIID
jgi:aspartyl protease family protein